MFKRTKYDLVLLSAVLAIVAIGVVMITSVECPTIELSAPDMKYPTAPMLRTVI